MSLADPFSMPDVRQRHARGANRDPYAPIDRRHRYEGPLDDPRAMPFDPRTARVAFAIRRVIQAVVIVSVSWAAWAVLL